MANPGPTSTTGSGAAAATRRAADHGQQLERSRGFGVLLMVGLIAYGIVHLLLAWIAVQIAWTGGGGEASQQGAMAQLASTSVGLVVLWLIAVGLVALVLWQAGVAAWGYTEEKDRTRLARRLTAGIKAVVYAALAVSAVRAATAGGQSGDSQDKAWTARLMTAPAGRVLVIVLGLVVVGVGGAQIYRGVRKKFLDDLEGSVSQVATRLGEAGYAAKGVAYAVLGVLFVIAGITFDPAKAGGLDAALRTLRNLTFGSVLLTLVALGVACFGAFCFYWSRHAKR